MEIKDVLTVLPEWPPGPNLQRDSLTTTRSSTAVLYMSKMVLLEALVRILIMETEGILTETHAADPTPASTQLLTGVIIALKTVLLDVLVRVSNRKRSVYSVDKFCCRFIQSHLITQERGHRLWRS